MSYRESYIDTLPSVVRKPKTFWSEIKSLLLNDTHFRDYLPLMNQNEKQKVVRIHNDKAFISNESQEDYWAFLPKSQPWDPSNNLFIAWIIIVCLVNTYFLYEAGIVMTFGATIWQQEVQFKLTYSLSWIFLIIYVADIFITLNTGYYMDGILILDRKRILSRYIKYLLIIDIPCIVIIFLTLTAKNFGINYAKFYFLTKLIEMNSLDYVIQRKLQIHRYLKAIYLILRILWIVMWISNVIGLIFYLMDYYILNNGIYPPDFCWLVSSTAFNNIIGQSWEVQYLYIIYWGVNTITTISYGDIAPGNPIEVVYTLVCFVIAFVIYSYVLNQIVQTVLWAKQVRENYRNQLVIINTFMRRKDVNQQLQQKTTQYLQFLYEEQSLRDQNLQKQMIAKLPQHLKLVLLKDAFKLFYMRLTETFQRFPQQFISQLLDEITQSKLSNNQIIFQQGENTNQCLYMLSKGTINLIIKYGKMKSNQHLLKSVTIPCRTFGQLQFVTGNKRRYSAVSEDVSALYYVQRESMLRILQKSSKCNQYFQNLNQQIQINKKYYLVNYECPQCLKSHIFQQCPQLFPQIKPYIVFKSCQSQEISQQPISRVMIKRRKSIHPGYRSKREVANQLDKYSPKLQIQQIIRFKLQRRMAMLQYHINTLKEKFEVDLYHDWEYYKPELNPSNVFYLINKSHPIHNP